MEIVLGPQECVTCWPQVRRTLVVFAIELGRRITVQSGLAKGRAARARLRAASEEGDADGAPNH